MATMDYASLLPFMGSIWGQISKNATSAGENGCMTTSIACDKRPQVRISAQNGGGNKKYYIEVIAAMKSTGRAPRRGEEASHFFCNNQKCINPDHITFENGDMNKSRIYCKVFKDHPSHICLHEPQCAK